jgi:hypothetical protein
MPEEVARIDQATPKVMTIITRVELYVTLGDGEPFRLSK